MPKMLQDQLPSLSDNWFQMSTSLFIQYFLFQGLYKVFWCSYGPGDCRANLPTAASLAAEKRKRPLEYGTGQKRGCQAHFSVFAPYASPEKVQIRLNKEEHVDAAGSICHGPECPGHGMYKTSPSLSAECHAFVNLSLMREVPAKCILQQWQQLMCDRYAKDHDLESSSAARIAMTVSPSHKCCTPVTMGHFLMIMATDISCKY